MSEKIWRVAGINFDHFHMGDLLRMVFDHPRAEIVGICDEDAGQMGEAIGNFGLRDDQVFTDYRECMETTKPDLVALCPAAARQAEWVEKVAPFGSPILMEKPFGASLEDAERMIAATEKAEVELAVNWPLRWYASHATAFRLVTEGLIGEVLEVHFYDGNRGPLWHGADKIEKEPTAEEKDSSWFYKRDEGGGSLLDYLGYGTTLGTWFNGGQVPIEVSCLCGGTESLEVDEHSITVARYPGGRLSKFETRWGTFSDPWTHQPQPKCGFVLKGIEGTLSSYDMEQSVRIQTADFPEGREIAADDLSQSFENPVQYVLHCLETGEPIEGPLSPEVSRVGQLIVDAAVRSARERKVIEL
jgi:glucose-fructose oxidoreductase